MKVRNNTRQRVDLHISESEIFVLLPHQTRELPAEKMTQDVLIKTETKIITIIPAS